jgi:hypothetical protein
VTCPNPELAKFSYEIIALVNGIGGIRLRFWLPEQPLQVRAGHGQVDRSGQTGPGPRIGAGRGIKSYGASGWSGVVAGESGLGMPAT